MPEVSIWSRERNTTMKVFSQLYVGVRKAASGTPLGFATPFEDNTAGRKRQETVRNWVGGTEPDIAYKNNVPAPGFKITDDVKRVYWGGGNVVWRVEDPRGFELEIQSNNLMAIIQSCGIQEGGLIPGNCVWGRSGGDNILLHETSDEYKDAVKAAETLKAPKQVGKAKRKVGALYRCANGSLGIYLGKVHVTVIDYSNESQDTGCVTLTGGQRIVVSTTTSMINPSTEFEAVLGVTRDRNDEVIQTRTLKLYKKAPLVDEMEVKVELPDVDNAFLFTLNWAFASALITPKRIVSVTTNPIPNPEACLVKLPEHMFESKILAVRRYMKVAHQMFYPFLLLSHRNDEAVVFNNVLCGQIETIGNTYSNDTQTEPTYSIALPMTLAGNKVTFTSYDGRENPLTDKRNYPSKPLNVKMNSARSVDHVRLPFFENGEDLLKYLQQLYDDCSMFYVTARESTKDE